MATMTCTPLSAGLPSNSIVTILDRTDPMGNVVDEMDRELTANGQNIFNAVAMIGDVPGEVEDGTTFRWQAVTEPVTGEEFVGITMEGTINCALPNFDFNVGFCEVIITGIPEQPNNGTNDVSPIWERNKSS